MRWTSRVRLLFLMPAVLWVLVFTIVPLVYSLYTAFHNVTNETVVNRVEVPRLDKDGKPALKPDGTPRMKTEVVRETGVCPRCRTRTEQECTRVTGADGSVAVEFRVCATCGAVS
jgi:ABC-type sugar transport system permease subunit